MDAEKLVRMANQIATAFAHLPQEAAAQSVAGHINNFWDPRMRAELLQRVAEGGAGLAPTVLAAAPEIRRPAPARA
jgi:formate dehydrogenase subunit delta